MLPQCLNPVESLLRPSDGLQNRISAASADDRASEVEPRCTVYRRGPLQLVESIGLGWPDNLDRGVNAGDRRVGLTSAACKRESEHGVPTWTDRNDCTDQGG